MSRESKIATIRGAGLAFPIACLWYVFSGQILVFSLVLLGAGIGFGTGLSLQTQTVPGVTGSRLRGHGMGNEPSRLLRYLSHPIHLSFLTASWCSARCSSCSPGSNSLAILYAQRMAPSFTILGRSGPYEMIALVLLAGTTYFLSQFEVKQLLVAGPQRIERKGRFSPKDAMGMGLALLLLAGANWVEALQVMTR